MVFLKRMSKINATLHTSYPHCAFANSYCTL
nr:MAG TPA_asm: hypothetical protein [Caudoviricetes sp.]